MKLNSINTDGNGTIVINDINDSTITINTTTNEVLNFIKSLQEKTNRKNPEVINILIISTTKNRIDSFEEELDQSIPKFEDQYGDEPAFWKPFKNDYTIAEIIKEYQEKTRFGVNVFLVDNWSIDEDLKSDIEMKYRSNVIVIIDCNAMHCHINQKLISAFNHSDIGGGIIPVCETFSKDDRRYFKELSDEHLRNWLRCKYDYLGQAFINIEIEVPNKRKLFRRLTNIAIKNLKVLEIIDSGEWSNEFMKQGLASQGSRF